MHLAFLHGEIIVAWLLSGALALLVGSVVAVALWLYPPRSPLLPGVIYLLLAIVFVALWMSDESSLSTSSLGFAFAMPWSAMYFFAILQLQIEIPVWVVWPGLVVNSVLIYFGVKLARVRKLRLSQTRNSVARTVQ